MQMQLFRDSRPPRFPDRGRSTGFQARRGEGVRIPYWYWLASSGLGLLLVALLWAGIPEFESASVATVPPSGEQVESPWKSAGCGPALHREDQGTPGR